MGSKVPRCQGAKVRDEGVMGTRSLSDTLDPLLAKARWGRAHTHSRAEGHLPKTPGDTCPPHTALQCEWLSPYRGSAGFGHRSETRAQMACPTERIGG